MFIVMNITLRIPDELGKRAKHLAVDEGKSLSAVVVDLLKQRLNPAEEKYREIQENAWQVMEAGLHGGGHQFNREELYERDAD